ncbi:MAG: TonB-dependent receptor [Nitrosomonadales bacterium]|nr:TonB-dependent receptor [Nitrosomonadales bacterium]
MLGEVVVTATRSEIGAQQAPTGVTVVTASDIQTKNTTRLGDALQQVPSLYVRGGALGQSQGTQGTSSMSLRGIDQSRTLVLLDGQPLQDASSGKVNWRIPFIEDIQRIEIVPGAFSSLYGSNAIGGVVNIISKRPDRREFTTKIKKGWGDAGGEDVSVYFRGRMENGVGLVAGLGYQNRDSYVNDFAVKRPVAGVPGTPVTGAKPITTRDGLPAYLVGDLGRTPWRSINATTKLYYDLNAGDKIYAGINYQETSQRATGFNTYLRDAATGAPVSSGTLNVNGQRVVLTNYDFTLFSFLPLRETTTQFLLGYDGVIGDDYLLKIDMAKITRGYQFTMASPTANWDNGTGTLSDTPNDAIDGSVQLSFPVGERHFLVTGIALHQDKVNQQILELSNWRDPGSTRAVNSGYNGQSTTVSIFAQDEINVTDAFTLYLGGRWDDWKTQGDNFSNIAPLGTTIHASRTVSAISPKISAVYKPFDTVTLRTSFGKSFRAPTNQDLYTSSTSRGRTTTGDPDLKPEQGTTWELGGEWRNGEGSKFTATYYETQLSDLIYLQQVSATKSLRINAGKAKVKGLELAVATRLTGRLELEANYAYIDSRMLDNLADPLSVGKRLTDVPKNIAGVSLTARQGAWTGVLSARHYSHIFWTAQNTDIVEGVPGSYDAHTMVNANIGYEFSRGVKGRLDINNLFNTKAYSYFLLPGRNLTVEMSFAL